MNRGRVLAAAGLMVLLVSGCTASGTGSDEPETTAPAQAPGTTAPAVFTGTPDEYTLAHRTCMERAGFTIDPAPEGSGGGFQVDQSGHTDAEVSEAIERCGAEIGSPDLTTLTDEQMRASYDMRVSIQQCLVDNGWSTDQPMAWETFRDEWHAGAHWEPMLDATADVSVSVTVASKAQSTCDRQDGQTW